MALSPEFRALIEELLAPLGPVSVRRMFGGAGMFYEGVMFALISGDTLYLKTDDRNRARFEAEGCPPFTYRAKDGRNTVLSYFRAPERLIDEPDELLDWCRSAIEAALRAHVGKKNGKKVKSRRR